MPPMLESMEVPHEGLQQYLDAFDCLVADRPIFPFGGQGNIPLHSILAYCEMFSINDADERTEFMSFIRALDDEDLAEQRKHAEAEKARND